jgi:hypothetical protein
MGVYVVGRPSVIETVGMVAVVVVGISANAKTTHPPIIAATVIIVNIIFICSAPYVLRATFRYLPLVCVVLLA